MATSRLSTRRVDWRVQVGTSNKAAQGLVIFEASVSYIPDPLAAGGPRTAIPEPVPAVLDAAGYACTPDPANPARAGERGVNLFTTDSLGEDGGDWTWTARPQLRSVNGIQMANAVPAFSFTVPTGPDGLDLATVQKVPASPGLGTEQAVAVVRRAEQAIQDALNMVEDTVGQTAQTAVGEALDAANLVRGSDERLPTHEENPGLSVALTDVRGHRTHLEANDTDGGPTEFAMSLSGPALQQYMDFVTGDDKRVPEVSDVPGKSLVMTDARGRELWLQANDTDGGPTAHTVAMLRSYLAVPADSPPVYITDGDSITQGGHGGGDSWQSTLSGLMGGTPVINSGVSGTTATEIGIRQGGVVPILTLAGGALPSGTTPVAVEVVNLPSGASWWSGSTQPARSYKGTLEGIPSTLTRSKDGAWTVSRLAAGAAVRLSPRTPFFVETLPRNAIRIIWPGRNDYPKSQVRESIDRMARWITEGGGRFLVVSILTRSGEPETYNDALEVIEQNRITQEVYPHHYADARGFLVTNGLDAAGVTPTQADLDAQAVGAIPPSLMFDNLHPNEAGRRAIGTYLYQQLKLRNWA